MNAREPSRFSDVRPGDAFLRETVGTEVLVLVSAVPDPSRGRVRIRSLYVSSAYGFEPVEDVAWCAADATLEDFDWERLA